MEGVEFYFGVATVHLGLLAPWKTTGQRVPSPRRTTTGGPAPAHGVVEASHAHGIGVIHRRGTTETSPIGSVSKLTALHDDLDDEERILEVMRPGRPPFGVEPRIVDADGRVLPPRLRSRP